MTDARHLQKSLFRLAMVTASLTWGAPVLAQDAPLAPVAPPAPVAPLASDVTPVQAATAPTASEADDEKLPFKLSLPTEDDWTAWKSAGFRMQLGLGYGQLLGLGGAPSGRLIDAVVRVGARLDSDWSVLGSFQYGSAARAGGLSALRFAGTLDPTWHMTESIDLAVGFGFAGLVEGRTDRADPDTEQRTTLVDSYTLPNARQPLASCSGIGAAGLARVGWTRVLGPLSSTGIQLELDGQWTGCVESLGRVEPDTARPIVRRQWWPHVGGTVAWVVGWR